LKNAENKNKEFIIHVGQREEEKFFTIKTYGHDDNRNITISFSVI